MLYGEGGERAFIRLQMEIIRKSDDESIFAWDDSVVGYDGMLASSPRLFAGSGDIVSDSKGKALRPPYAMTNKGLEFHIPNPPLPNGEIIFKCFRKRAGLYATVTIERDKYRNGGGSWLRACQDQPKWRETAPSLGVKPKAIHIY